MKNKWIHFSIDRESLIGMLSGVGIVILSVIMTIFNNDIANIILRDILMILVLGFFFPLYFTIIGNKKSVSVLGIHKKKIVISLAINIIAAISPTSTHSLSLPYFPKNCSYPLSEISHPFLLY